MPSILITGAGRGIGLELARQYASDGWDVHATLRDAAQADTLHRLGSKVTVHQLEVTDKDSMDALSRDLRAVPLDVVISNSGVTGPRGMTMENVDRDSWLETLAVNTIAPMALAAATKRSLDKGKQKKLIAISSTLGSIADNRTSSLYAYRSSKAALNMVWKNLSLDLAEQNYICVTLHPGWVKTDMGGKDAEITAEDSVRGMRKVIEGLTTAQNGAFLSYAGKELLW